MFRLLLLFLTAMSFGCDVHGGIWNSIVDTFRGQTAPPPPTIRILVEHDTNKAQVEVTGKYSLYDPYSNSFISSRFIGKNREIQAMSDGLKWGEAFPGLYQLKIVPDDHESAIVINGKTYFGSIYVYDIGGTISIINQVPVEAYVGYALAKFTDQSLHPEVLAALAIVARTNAYFMIADPKNAYWAIDANRLEYEGKQTISHDVYEAVHATRYMIMSHTGVYDKVATPFAAQFGQIATTPSTVAKEIEVSKISLAEASAMAATGAHAAQILARAFPGTTIMLMHYSN